MRTHVRATAVALILIGLATGCQRTTEGSVAMTTEPGPPLASPTRTPSSPSIPGFPSIPIPDIRIPGLPNTDLPEVPAPPNSTTMTCAEYNDLDDATKLAVIRAIIAEDGNSMGPEREMIALLMTDSMCQFMPDSAVNEVVIGLSPP